MSEFMSYMKIEELLLKDTMRRAQIPGVSIAYVNHQGVISTQEIGLTDGCGLVKMSNDPTQCPFQELVLGSKNELGVGTKNTVIAFNNHLYYVDQAAKMVQKIVLTEANKIAYKMLHAKCTETYQLADSNEHEFIATLTGRMPPTEVKPETVFGAASLSKPVFAYLVQELIQTNAKNQSEAGFDQFILPEKLKHFDLDTPLFHIIPLEEFNIDGMKFDLSDESIVAHSKILTARMVLSHTTGLAHGEMKFQFLPNSEEKEHGYSNVGIIYLQQVIEKLTGSDLETLAQKHVFEPCGMIHSTYGLKACAANSLLTTACDYANFVKHLIHDSTIENPFVPHAYMTKDKGQAGAIGIAKGNIPDAILQHVAWGLGWGLQTNNEGRVITAYHSGDMNDYRAWVVIDLQDKDKKNAVVFFANSHNGHILAEQIIPKTMQMEQAANYFFSKWGFARNLAELGGKTTRLGIKSSSDSSDSSPDTSIQDEPVEIKKETEKSDISSIETYTSGRTFNT
ncbi:TPA: serine hydrolase [Legionella pneumophila subsp. pneumophila]|nr:class A beta-lactamase-related serine hydrolase [Legionella pneumophila]HAT8853525.1 serine hydrolase [Legionella pneumophila subsp. pneumophila]TIE25565.1 esterase [Legionella pneumophila]TIE46876.1 esterase [Legionella pneumophila]HAT8752421.1 serine hydrolase [Legionella pneumophila]